MDLKMMYIAAFALFSTTVLGHPCDGLEKGSVVDVDTAKACARSVPLPPYDFVGYQVLSIRTVLDSMYAYSDIVQDPSNLDPSLRAIPDDPRYKGWRPHEAPKVDWEAELDRINATAYANTFDALVDMSSLFSSMQDAHTALIGGPLMTGFIVAGSLGIVSSLSPTGDSQVFSFTKNSETDKFQSLLGQGVNLSALTGKQIRSINKQEPLEFLQVIADQFASTRDPGVRFNFLLNQLMVGKVALLTSMPDSIPSEWAVDFEDGSSKILPYFFSYVNTNTTNMYQKQFEIPKFTSAIYRTVFAREDYNYTEVHEEMVSMLDQMPETAYRVDDGASATNSSSVFFPAAPTASVKRMPQRYEGYAATLKANSTCGPMPDLLMSSSENKGRAFAMFFNVSNTPVIQWSSVGTTDEALDVIDLFIEALHFGEEAGSERLVVDLSSNGGGSVAAAFGVLSTLWKDFDTKQKLCAPLHQRQNAMNIAFHDLFDKEIPRNFSSIEAAEKYVKVLDDINVLINVTLGIELDADKQISLAFESIIHNSSMTEDERLEGCSELLNQLVIPGLEALLAMPGFRMLRSMSSASLEYADGTDATKSAYNSGSSYIRGADKESHFSKAVLNPICTSNYFIMEAIREYVEKLDFWFKEIVLLTDGNCGSACSLVLTQLMSQPRTGEQRVKVVSYGGTGDPIDSSSFRGGVVLNTADGESEIPKILTEIALNVALFQEHDDEAIDKITHHMPIPDISAAYISFNFEEGLPFWEGNALPIEWLHKPAEFHWNAWYTLGPAVLALEAQDGGVPDRMVCEQWGSVYEHLVKGHVETPPDNMVSLNNIDSSTSGTSHGSLKANYSSAGRHLSCPILLLLLGFVTTLLASFVN